MPATFSFGLALELRAWLAEESARARLTSSKTTELRARAREAIAQSRDLMVAADDILAAG